MCESETTGPTGNMRNDQVIALVVITFNWLAGRIVN